MICRVLNKIHADGANVNNTFEHRWAIHERAPGKDFYNWTGRCLSAGGVYEPHGIDVDNRHPEQYCRPGLEGLCRIGDFTTRVNGLYRRKAVIRDWFGNGEPVPLKGKLELTQQSEYDVTNVQVTLEGFEGITNYKIHVAPVEKDLEFPCEKTSLYDTYNPFKVDKNQSPPPTKGTADQYELGDLGNKYGLLDDLRSIHTDYNETQVSLYGPYSILGRSVVLHRKNRDRRWACSSVERGYSPSEAREIRGIASFHHPGGFAWGYVRMTQLIHNDGSASDTVLEVKLRHPGVRDRNLYRGAHWRKWLTRSAAIVELKQLSQWWVIGWVTKNYYLELLRASEGKLSRWSRLHLQSLAPTNPHWARVVVPSIDGSLEPSRIMITTTTSTDISFTASRFCDNFTVAIQFDSHALLPFYLKGRSSTAYLSQLLDIGLSKRDDDYFFLLRLSGIGGDRQIFMDSNFPLEGTVTAMGRSIVIFGPERSSERFACANIEPDYDIVKAVNIMKPPRFVLLLASGRLDSPSIFIPGFVNTKRKRTISYRQCGVTDPNEKKKSSFFFSSGVPSASSARLLLALALIATLIIV
ncbi:hypothetical protein evm_005499 [Chilo suppressalis]|nr:hypothetical protein evm_005499 [Chilo suppressalis]